MTYLIISLQSQIASLLPRELRTFAQAPWYNAGPGAKPCAESYRGRQQHRAFHGLSELLLKSPRSPTAALAPDRDMAVSGQTQDSWFDITNENKCCFDVDPKEAGKIEGHIP